MAALVGETVAEDELPKNETLEEHDKKHHGGHFDPDKGTCKFRDQMSTEPEKDKADIESPDAAPKGDGTNTGASKRSIVTPEEDAAYMEAVEKGDMETAAKMVREVAAKAFPNTKILDEDGKPKVVYHNSDIQITTPAVPWEGPIEWDGLPGMFFANREQKQYGVNKHACFINIRSPLDMNAGGNPGLHARSTDQMEKFAHQYEDAIRAGEKEFKFGEDGVLEITDKGMSLLKNDGYYGKHPSDDEGEVVEYAVLSPRQVKSADPVTYDDDGNVIPLSRRFDDGDDIRGDVNGSQKDEYRDLMEKYPELDADAVLLKISKLDTAEEMAAEFARIMESGKIEETVDNKPLVTPEEDAAYLDAAEKGDEKAVKRLFEKAAKRYLADSKVQSKVWHNTKKKFTEFRNNFPNVFFFAKDRKWADIFGKEERYSTKENTKPYYVRLGKPLDMRGERTGNEWLKFFEDNGIKLGEKGVEKLSKVGEETLPGWTILNHDVSEPHGPGYRDSMVAAGFDGAVFEDKKRGTADRTTYGVFNSNAIKSANPVTYDNEGKVIPLSRRFNDGDDIRGDVSGKTEYIEKMKLLHPDINSEELIDRLKNLGSREEMEAEIKKILGKK